MREICCTCLMKACTSINSTKLSVNSSGLAKFSLSCLLLSLDFQLLLFHEFWCLFFATLTLNLCGLFKILRCLLLERTHIRKNVIDYDSTEEMTLETIKCSDGMCNNCIFEDNERFLDLLKHLLFGTLFQWACIWGPTQCISISAFYNLLAASFRSSLLYFLHIQSVHHHEHDVHFVNKSSITYPKKEEVILLFFAFMYLFCTHNHHLDTQIL